MALISAAIPDATAPSSMPASPAPVAPITKANPKQEIPATVQVLAVSTTAPSYPESPVMSNDESLSKKLGELRPTRESNKMKESEITILKKEIEWMKYKLRECTAGVKTIKAKKASGHSVSKKKAAEAYQTC